MNYFEYVCTALYFLLFFALIRNLGGKGTENLPYSHALFFVANVPRVTFFIDL